MGSVELIKRNYIDRTQRIRDAKSEAQKEIEEYKNQKEEEYKEFEGEVRYSSYNGGYSKSYI